MHYIAFILAFNLCLVVISNIIFKVIKLRMLILVDYLFVRKSGLSLWVPVNHANTPINVTLFVEVAEHLDNTLATDVIHCKSCTIPIAGTTKSAQLFEDNTTMFMCPVPCMLKELLTCKVGLLYTLLSEATYNLCFCSNTCMVCTWNPASILTLHAGTSYQNVLNSIVQHVTHVKHTCYVWWWNNHGVRLTAVRLRTEKLVVQPILVPF